MHVCPTLIIASSSVKQLCHFTLPGRFSVFHSVQQLFAPFMHIVAAATLFTVHMD